MKQESKRLRTFKKYSGDDESFIFLLSVGIAFLMVEISVKLLELSGTGELPALGGLKVIALLFITFIIWTSYFKVKNGDIE